MRTIPILLAALLALAPTTAQTRAVVGPRPGLVRVRLVTPMGPIVVAVDTRRAPKTSANFLAYVDDGRFDGTTFYRAARSKVKPGQGFIQGGIRTDARRILPPFPLETTAMTGIRHTDGVISMARAANPDSAGGNFILTVGPAPALDARPGYAGYAAFGHVVSGMDVVKRILAERTGGGMDAMRGQMILRILRIVRAQRLDGTPKPTGSVKPWLFEVPR